MPGLLSLALTTEQTIEILSLYATSSQQINAVAAAPGWNVVGSFSMPTTADIRLSVIGSVSDPSETMTVRMYDITPGLVGVVSGSLVVLTNLTEAEFFSGIFTLTGAHVYQIQAEVVGSAGDTFFGTVRRAAPMGI